MLGLKSPRNYTIRSFPDDELVGATHGGMLDIGNRVFHFGDGPASHSLYHEAAHWVLMNNSFIFMDVDVFPIFGRALDETLAELCANTLDGKANSEVITDLDEAKGAALALLSKRKEIEAQAGLYLLDARAEGRADDPVVQFTAAHIFTLPVVAHMTVKAFELEEFFNRDRAKMADAYKQFAALWKQQGNWIVERGVAGALGVRSGAILSEKSYHPRNVLDEIKEDRLLCPMQLYWNVIVPKL